jgi:hypothetical protein
MSSMLGVINTVALSGINRELNTKAVVKHVISVDFRREILHASSAIFTVGVDVVMFWCRGHFKTTRSLLKRYWVVVEQLN